MLTCKRCGNTWFTQQAYKSALQVLHPVVSKQKQLVNMLTVREKLAHKKDIGLSNASQPHNNYA